MGARQSGWTKLPRKPEVQHENTQNHLRLLILLLLVLLACAGYMTVGVHFENQNYLPTPCAFEHPS